MTDCADGDLVELDEDMMMRAHEFCHDCVPFLSLWLNVYVGD